jgi:phosphoribosylformimino-5-aminoimidazole carboxamide ribotide isomerase
MNIIPAIDLRDGHCVRLYQGDFDHETQYGNDPAAVAQGFAGLGLRQLHIVDLDGARTGTQKNEDIVAAIAARTSMSLQLGGGIRERGTLARWFDAGVDRCVIGSLAITEPRTIEAWISEFGADRIVLALDVRIGDDGIPGLSTHGWTRSSGVNLWDCIRDYQACGLKHVLCTDVSRDGAMAGPNTDLYREFGERFADIALQASGGVRNIDDLVTLRNIGAASAITGRALLDGKITQEEIRSFLQNA